MSNLFETDLEFKLYPEPAQSNTRGPQKNKNREEANLVRKFKKHNKEARILLDKLQLSSSQVKKKTVLIIHNVLTDLRLPKNGEQIRYRTQQQINLISMILLILKYEEIEELTITTYTFNREALYILTTKLKAGQIKKINLIIASSYGFRDPKYYEYLKQEIIKLNKKYDIHLTFAWIHLKITLAKTHKNYYQMEGSMNYSTNNMVEQLLFENSKIIYQEDFKFIESIFEKENKALEVVC